MTNIDNILAQLDFTVGGSSTIAFDPNDMVRELVAYGEKDAAERILDLDVDAIKQIGLLAHKHYSAEDTPMLDKAICLGVIEFLEGESRPLKRKRRIYDKTEKTNKT